MSSRSRCAAGTTAKFIDMVTRQHGGQRSALSHSGRQMLCSARHTRSREGAFAWSRCTADHGWTRPFNRHVRLDHSSNRGASPGYSQLPRLSTQDIATMSHAEREYSSVSRAALVCPLGMPTKPQTII
jgi:hypothetical protein